MTTHCQGCGGVLVPFYPENDKRISAVPMYCEACSSLWIGDKQYSSTEQNQLESIADQAKSIAEKMLEEIKQDPERRIQYYFERVFGWAFAEGFMRAYAYFRHKFKEGRLKRIRVLWNKSRTDEMLTVDEMDELNKLINLSA